MQQSLVHSINKCGQEAHTVAVTGWLIDMADDQSYVFVLPIGKILDGKYLAYLLLTASELSYEMTEVYEKDLT